jgi:ubiquinone/menaquinone biosynthesis C-methylase UbiE
VSVEGDWNRLYSEFPEVYDAFARVRHEPEPIDVIGHRWRLAGATVIDVGSGSGTSTFEFAERAASVTGVEPNPALRALAEEHAQRACVRNVSFVEGSASVLPCADGSADFVACITTSFWPPERVVPEFVAEAERVLRPGGAIIVLNTSPGSYGGEFYDLLGGGAADEYDGALDAALAGARFAHFDFATVQDYGTPDHAVATYGFIFGSRAIERLRERGQSRISWRWRIRHRTR